MFSAKKRKKKLAHKKMVMHSDVKFETVSEFVWCGFVW
jgi:hypothetical protein